MSKIKIGSKITLVDKGIQEGYGHSWVNSTQIGRTTFLRVSKCGIKYVYGAVFFTENDEIKNYYHESKFDTEKYKVLEGIRNDLKEKYDEYRTNTEVYNKLYENTRRDFERSLQDELRKKIDQWITENPRPQPISLDEVK